MVMPSKWYRYHVRYIEKDKVQFCYKMITIYAHGPQMVRDILDDYNVDHMEIIEDEV